MKKTFQLSPILLTVCLGLLILFPFVYDSRSLMIMFTQIFIFAVFAMSYDLLLGYTGIVSFGHAMFFGIGAYSTGILLDRGDPTLMLLVVSIVLGMILAAVVSYLVGLLTLRLKSHFYAMLTLALAGLFLVMAEKWRTLTFGNDGFTFSVPDFVKDRLTFYLVCLAVMVVVFLLLKRLTNSPLGKVLVAVRENEARTQSLGYQTIHYKIIASVIAGVLASVAGSLYVLSLRFVNTSVFTMDVTLDALLMTIIGGVGTLVGPILGAGIIEVSHHWLSELGKTYPIFERWIIFFGILYILAVMFFPAGIVGTLRGKKWKKKKQEQSNKEKEIAG
ncbi:branched-chain amino acid ABC transporter permease [Bacillus weihaiensis]|uniref:branched-chain amino acid ABC transporter permease n=1 Tax=Bacillus weihaiensis TaxID=1547283 RepID=UPI0023572DB1|nr:branched-chain amino acid ABC transporter permease [Bacillus weihaiensis]